MIHQIKKTPHPIDVHVGKMICDLRRYKRLSQSEIATRIGVSYQQLHKYEKAKDRISASKIFLLAKALDVSVDFFFQGMESKNVSS